MNKNQLLHELNCDAVKAIFLQHENYCSISLPNYIDFTKILKTLDKYLQKKSLLESAPTDPVKIEGVNYTLYANKDGKLSWRPLEMIHPIIYVELIKIITEEKNWKIFQNAFSKQKESWIERCSGPYERKTNKNQTATEILNYWESFEQKSLALSLKFSVLHHTDITNFYASIYTHSISWALHGKEEAKKKQNDKNLLGNKLDKLIRAGRNGETMGIPQGSMLMDFIAELILAYTDLLLTNVLQKKNIQKDRFHILRYRDDYRIFTNDNQTGEEILKAISDVLQSIRLSLGSSKTKQSSDVISGSIKKDKLAAINLNDLGTTNAKTFQKQLLRIHNFSQEYPNSSRTGILLSNLLPATTEKQLNLSYENLEVCLAIITEIIFHAPNIFPMSSRLIAILLSKTNKEKKDEYWDLIFKKLRKLSNTGIMDLHMQRIAFPNNLAFSPEELFCKVIQVQYEVFYLRTKEDSKLISLWKNDWLCEGLQNIFKKTPLLSKNPQEISKIPTKEEINSFTNQDYY